ncbi:threonine/serine dehydratase, partial [Streptomyces sp. NPDC057144]
GGPAPAAGGGPRAPRRVVERVGEDARIGLVVCGGNATVTDMAGWADRFGLR